MKNNGDNLILGCEEVEEKPLWSIGDGCVLSGNLMNAEVIGIYEGMAWVKIEGEAITVPISHLSKPKTKQDIIKETLTNCVIDCVDEYLTPKLIADEILNRFNVTEK